MQYVSKKSLGRARSAASMRSCTPSVVRDVRSGRESLFELEPHPIEEVRNYLNEVSRQWDDALARLKFVCGKRAPHILTAKRASQDPPHLAATSKNRAFCDGNTTCDNFFRSLCPAALQLSQSFFTKQVYKGPGADARMVGKSNP